MDRDDHFVRTNTELAKLAAKGVTVVVASGDCGFNSKDDCDAKPSATVSSALPSFPCTSPYVTCVGGSQFAPTATQRGGDAIGEEVAVQAGGQWGMRHGWQAHGSSGGGFSSYFGRADFQSAVVASYLAHAELLPPASFFNASGRGIPDVATLAGLPDYDDFTTHYLLMRGRHQQGFDGTSASAPTFAGVVAHLNHARLQAGKPSLGWANPFLYSAAAASPAAFFDITRGDNQYAFQTGFNATTGWDAVTGLGSPNTELLAVLAAEY
jgi:tripeptidyl-peptidase-1